VGDVNLEWRETSPPDEALSRLLAGRHDTIEGQGYRERRRARRSVSFTRRRLLRSERFTILATESEDGGSVLMVEGSMRRRLRAEFAEIAETGRNGAAAPDTAEAQGDSRASSNGSKAGDPRELENELRRIYEQLGKPSAFREAKGKVLVLADCLGGERGIDRDRALALAYERSLAEHREYLAAKRISH
jgi:hypothetical protein